MKTAALDTAHVDIAFIHERLDKESKRFAAGPEGWIGADMRPESLHQFEAAADISDDLWKYSGSATGEHAQSHIGTWSHDIHELLQGEVWSNGFITLSGIFEQGKGIAQWRTLTHGKEQIFGYACLLLNQLENFGHT